MTVNQFESHFRGLVTLADALSRHGHDVRVAAPEKWGAWLQGNYGVETVDVGMRWADREFDAAIFGLLLDRDVVAFDRMYMTEFLGDRIALRVAEDVLDLSDRWRPDVVLHECSEFGGYLAAEVLEIPHVTVDIGPLQLVRDLHEDLIRPALTTQRAKLGLPEEPVVPGILQHLTVSLTPKEFNNADLGTPLVRYRHEPPVRHNDQLLPDVFTSMPDDRPIVYLSLGSIGPFSPRFRDRMAEIYREVFAALAELRCTAVVSLPSPYQHIFRSLPAHIHVLPYVPQSLVLANVDLFITHGGLNSMRDTITYGVPHLVLPFFADHPGNAVRCDALGTGIHLDPMTVTASDVLTACRRILDDPGYRQAARALKRRMWALPPQSAFTDDLRDLISGSYREK
ncbi:glycosyltransferase [Nocardia gamkensis]|uniref:glycosyltransferase n=1 Tax=Nocardia gamkensis TaxID=352869 RepID=UPI0037C50DFA